MQPFSRLRERALAINCDPIAKDRLVWSGQRQNRIERFKSLAGKVNVRFT